MGSLVWAALPLELLVVMPVGAIFVLIGLVLARRRRDPRTAPRDPNLAPDADPSAPTLHATGLPEPARRGLRLGILALICGPIAGIGLGVSALSVQSDEWGFRLSNAMTMLGLGILAGVLGGVAFGIVALVAAWWAGRAEPAATAPMAPIPAPDLGDERA